MNTGKPSRSERGSVSVLAALLLVAVCGMGAFAVDYGYLRWKRSQLQTAVDAAALAGAAGLVSYGQDLARIRAEAVTFGRANIDARDNPALALTEADVTVNLNTPGWVEVTAGLTAGRGNPVRLFLGPVLGLDASDVSATARAEIFCSTTSRCIKPWSVPAKFTWNDNCGAAKDRNGVLDTGAPCEMDSISVQGYGPADVGTQIVLKTGDPHDTIAPGQYSPVDLPPVGSGQPVSGGSAYRDNIAGCTGANNTDVTVQDFLQLEPGNMVGPTKQGIQDLLAQDPGAYWDTSTSSIKGSAFPDAMASPRVGIITFFDPRDPPSSGRNTIVVYQLGAVFVEGISGSGDVTGRFVNATAVSPVRGAGGNCGTLWGISLTRDSTR